MKATISKALPVLDAEGYALCPDCDSRVNCGTIGLANLEKRHRGTKACKTAQAKRDKKAKSRKDGTILSFLKPKVTTVPSTVSSQAPVHSYKLAVTMYVGGRLLVMRKGVILNIFFFNDSETRPSTPPSHSPEGDEFSASETDAIDIDEAKASDVEEELQEEDAEDSEIGDFWGGIDDLGTIVSMGREEVGENSDMRDESNYRTRR
jgi:hypothetical protein